MNYSKQNAIHTIFSSWMSEYNRGAAQMSEETDSTSPSSQYLTLKNDKI